MLRNILALFLIASPVVTIGQTIQFEEKDYKQLDIYDTWEESPFRQGRLKGRYAVVENHLTEVDAGLGFAPNPSRKILAVQRSRFGSNTFGVKIDLEEPFELTPTTRYIHLMVHRSYAGRVMVVGLGKRRERAVQPITCEQFWAMSTVNIPADRWEEVVLPIKGHGGIDIYSLVVVPDCESPHNDTEDKMCYIDQIEINDQPQPRFVRGYYPVETPRQDASKELLAVGVKVGERLQTIPFMGERSYYTYVEDRVLEVEVGELFEPVFQFRKSEMQGSLMVDLNQNGRFDTMGGEVIHRSLSTLNLQAGIYRLRFEVEGHAVVDVCMNLHRKMCKVNDANRNGEVLSAKDGCKLERYETPYRQPFTIRMNPEQGFDYAGIVLKHGYHLGDDASKKGNPQWQKVRFGRECFDANNEFTIPEQYMDGDLEIEGLFIEQ